ncbi:MAG: hypothetical protein JSR54_12440 [Proteobacteria bacterium]|nr:hypothetical protein [Pseudomonadota bacterium]
MHEVALLEVAPAELAGRPAFRFHFRCRVPDSQGGATIAAVAVGAAMPFGLRLATFRAPAIYYQDQCLAAVEQALAGLPARPRRRALTRIPEANRPRHGAVGDGDLPQSEQGRPDCHLRSASLE